MYDTIIIGGGIAGLTASIYAARKRMKFEIITKEIGGQFMSGGEILNYPGVIKTTGAEFSSVMQKQLEFNNVNLLVETVEIIKRHGTNFKIITDKKEYDTKTIIIATGSVPRRINIKGEEKFAKKGVSYCSVCDGPLFSEMDVAVIGGGDSALEAVDFLKDVTSKIYMLVRKDKFRAHEYLQDRVKNNPKVEILFKSNVTEILGDKFVSGIKYSQKGEEKKLDIKGIFIEIGRIPNTELFKYLIELDKDNHIKINCMGHTSVPGIFAAGDCTSTHEYQYVIAAGQSCVALLQATKYLAKKT